MIPTASDIVRRHLGDGSHAHYAVLMTPAERRDQVAACFGLYATLRDILTVQPDVLPAKITWWHEEVERLRDGKPVHPLSTVLSGVANAQACDALNALLHGAVMDANQVQVTDETLSDYLHLRCGALQTLLGEVTDAPVSAELATALGQWHGLIDLILEARDPAFAERCNASLHLANAPDDDALLDAIVTRIDEARARADAVLASGARASIPGSVWAGLTWARWPRIRDATPGHVVPDLTPWRKLLVAWRSARRAHRPTGAKR